MSFVKGKIRRDTSSFAWDMGYGTANEKDGRERKASGSREGRGKETTDERPSFTQRAAEQAPNVGRGPARPGQSLPRSLSRCWGVHSKLILLKPSLRGRANTGIRLIAMSSDVGKPTNPSTM